MKEQTNILIDADLKQKAIKRGMKLGEFFNECLRRHLEIKKSDLPEEKLLMICDNCNKIVEYGFYCEETKRFFCEECEKATINTESGVFTKYPCHSLKEHFHLRVPNLNGDNKEIVEEIIKKQKIKTNWEIIKNE